MVLLNHYLAALPVRLQIRIPGRRGIETDVGAGRQLHDLPELFEKKDCTRRAVFFVLWPFSPVTTIFNVF